MNQVHLLVDGDCRQTLSRTAQPSLGNRLHGCVDLAYLDPPFNTGRHFGAFDDQSPPSAWLAFMKECLQVTRDTLRPMGVVFVHLPASSAHRVQLMMDDVFGTRNFLNAISWVRGTTRAAAQRRLASSHDVILVFGRSAEAALRLPDIQRDDRRVDSAYRHSDDRGRYRYDSMTSPGVREGPAGAAWRGYDPTSHGRHWSIPRLPPEQDPDVFDIHERLNLLLAAGLVELPQQPGRVPRIKRYLESARGPVLGDVWADIPSLHSRSRERVGFPTQKPEQLLKRIIELGGPLDGVVLDPFAGSGTTAAVAHKLGRSWVAIESNPKTVTNVIAPRLTRVVEGHDPHGITTAVNWLGGGSFDRVH